MNGNEFMEISRNQDEYEADCIKAEMGDHAFNIMCEEREIARLEAEEANLHSSAREFFRGVPGRGVDY